MCEIFSLCFFKFCKIIRYKLSEWVNKRYKIKNGNLVRGKIYREGVLFYDGQFEDGKITTEGFKAYYTNGALMFKGGLSKGKLHGRCKLMTIEGQIRLKGEFKDGEIVGETCRMLYKNNNLVFEGHPRCISCII